jgi:hypothetical protein
VTVVYRSDQFFPCLRYGLENRPLRAQVADVVPRTVNIGSDQYYAPLPRLAALTPDCYCYSIKNLAAMGLQAGY